MGLPPKALSLFSISSLFFITIFLFFPSAIIAADDTNLVYKGCADQKFQDSTGIYSQNLKTLLSSLVSQSSQKPFSNATSGGGQNDILGLYQCRGDLTVSDCNNCVSKVSAMADNLCGKAIAARIQLYGCYLRYEVVGFKQVSDTELLYKACGPTQSSENGFEQKRDTAFDMVESGVKSDGGGASGGLFYTGSYESVYVLGQCEGDLGTDSCVDCVKSAAERSKAECGYSISAKVYLQKCYISYSYYPSGVPSISSASGTGQKPTQRTVAIAVGGLAAFAFVIVCLLFLKSLIKKRGGKHGGFV
ncbi:plasmodesmata-located protein 1-like [Corylus avellana]|uniref:plasmodesmata-located protein 1-like n=1 Tax=Corylus avellana TaxID=13451 RepID=UPI00286D3C98|nr:plasmodesmata-located protein 1-like [Corylus avellana]